MNNKDYLKWLTTRWWLWVIIIMNVGSSLSLNSQNDYYGLVGSVLGTIVGTYLFLIFIIMSFRYLYLKIRKKS